MIRNALRRQTLASFDYQWRELPEGGALLSDDWFTENVARIVSEELLCLRPEWFAGKRVLDAGCGTGRWTVGLLQLGARVTAADFSDAALEHTRENVGRLCSPEDAARLETRQLDLLNVPGDLARERFDCVFSFGVLHHTGDTLQALRNVASLVADDGVIFLYLYGKRSLSRPARLSLTIQRLALAPLPFAVKRRVVGLVRRGSDLHQSFDALSPTINTRHELSEVQGWLQELGFSHVARTIEHSELFVRAFRNAEPFEPFLLPFPRPPFWFERYV